MSYRMYINRIFVHNRSGVKMKYLDGKTLYIFVIHFEVVIEGIDVS